MSDRDFIFHLLFGLYSQGILHQDFIIEIYVKPWKPEDPRNAADGCGTLINFHPIHDDEERKCYFRRQASLVQVEQHNCMFSVSCLAVYKINVNFVFGIIVNMGAWGKMVPWFYKIL